MSAILFLGLFITSLTSHGPIVGVVGILLIVFYCILRGLFSFLNRNTIIAMILSAIFFIIQAFYLLLDTSSIPSQASRDALLNNLIMCILLMIFCVCLYLIIKYEKHRFISNLKVLIIIQLSVFFVQFCVVYSSGYYLDMVQPFTGETSRYLNYFTPGAAAELVAYRVTGLYVEPSTYVYAIVTLAFSYRLTSGDNKIFIASILSCLMAFATISFIVALFMLLSLIDYKKLLKIFVFLIFAIPLMLIMFWDFFLLFLDDFLLKFTMTSGLRFDLINLIYYLDGSPNIFGYGLFSVPNKIYMLADQGIGNTRIASLNDAGLINFIGMKFGLLGVLVVVGYTIFKLSYSNAMVFIAILLSKISFMHPIFFIALVPLFMKKNRKTTLLVKRDYE